MELKPESKSTFHSSLGIFYTILAEYNFELAKKLKETNKNETSVLNNYLSRLRFIITDIKLRFRTPFQSIYEDTFKEDTAMFIGSITHLACQVHEDSREAFESVLEDLVLGKLEMKQTKKGILLTETKTN